LAALLTAVAIASLIFGGIVDAHPELKIVCAHGGGSAPAPGSRAATTLIKGQKVGELYQEQQINDVVVWGASNTRADIESLRRLRISLPAGGDAPLGDVADVRIAPAPNIIQREGASRRIDVTCDVRGRDLGSVAREIEGKVKALSFDRGYHPEFLGEYAARQASRNRLLALSAFALLGILLLLHADFRSSRLVALVAVSLPFALVGGVAAALITGGVLSLGSLVGFVTVLGIAARNGVFLIDHYQRLEAEGAPFGFDLVLRGARERLPAILASSAATIAALLPIAVFGRVSGLEIVQPTAIVIVGGLVASTLVTLFVMPALYMVIGSGGGRRADLGLVRT